MDKVHFFNNLFAKGYDNWQFKSVQIHLRIQWKKLFLWNRINLQQCSYLCLFIIVIIHGYLSGTKYSKWITKFTWYLILGNNLAVLLTMSVYIVLLLSRMVGLCRILDTDHREETLHCVWCNKFSVQLLHRGLHVEIIVPKVSSVIIWVYISSWS